MSEKKVNKKLLIFAGLVLALAISIYLLPSDLALEKDNKPIVVDTTNDSSNNQIINSPETPQLQLPSVENYTPGELNEYKTNTYLVSTQELIYSKTSGIYNTYVDNEDYISNPFYQKYAYSKENKETSNDISKYPLSYYGTMASQKDFDSTIPE